MGIVSEKQDVSSWILFFGSSSPLSPADRALYSSIFQNSVLAGYRNSELVPFIPLKDPTDQALALSLTECGKMAGELLAAREREQLELYQEQITLIVQQKKLEILHQAALNQLELSKNSLLTRIKERATLTLQALSSISSPPLPLPIIDHFHLSRLGEFDRAQYLSPLLKTFQGILSSPEKRADEAAKDLQNQEPQVFSLELALQETNPARGIEIAGGLLRSRVENLRNSNIQLVQENGEGHAEQEKELTSRKKTHALFFKEISNQVETMEQSTSQTLSSWTSQAFPSALARDSQPGRVRYRFILACGSADYAHGAASCQHRLTLLCDDVVRLAKEADLFTGNP